MADAIPATVLGQLRDRLAAMKQMDTWSQIVAPRDDVFRRFQPLFASSHLASLNVEEFRPFLYFDDNHHWTGLHRQVNRVCADLPKLRKCLKDLLDESQPLESRLDKVAGAITGMGKGIITAILLVAHPDKYGVWNNTSEGALAVARTRGRQTGADAGERLRWTSRVETRAIRAVGRADARVPA